MSLGDPPLPRDGLGRRENRWLTIRSLAQRHCHHFVPCRDRRGGSGCVGGAVRALQCSDRATVPVPQIGNEPGGQIHAARAGVAEVADEFVECLLRKLKLKALCSSGTAE